MRFAIALFVLICIASIIGTVVKQNEPYNNYVNQFGPFWAEAFGAVGLYAIYSTPWFLLILAFLVVSTSLCIARNAPKIVADLRSYKESVREQALMAFHHRAHGRLALAPDAALQRASALLASHGWQARAQVREGGTMVAARKGVANKLGYLAAHSAIVLICIGGLLDGDLIVRTQMALLGKSTYAGGGLIRDVAPQHRLSERNPTFRGNLLVTEGARAGVAVLNMSDGIVLQELPFDIELKKFKVDFYDTGMPKLFASDIVIHDRASGERKEATVKVNEPAFHRGVAIYQSSFDDGGSQLTVQALPMTAGGQRFPIESTVGGSTSLTNGDQKLTIEFTGLRVINVENLDSAGSADNSATDVRKVDLVSSLDKHLGSGAKTTKDKTLRNVGPSFSYKLRDASGQAREYNNYMLPVQMEGQSLFLAGVRDTPAEPFRYLRMPADDQGNLDGWLRLKAALANPALREQAARRYVALATPADKPQMADQLLVTAQRVLQLFAGSGAAQGATQSGLNALAQFIESTVPEAERTRISEVLLRILNGTLFELANLSREQAGVKPMTSDEASARFMQQAVLSLSDATFYPAPVLLQLSDFKQVQASVFQVARAPGQKLVYLGAALLIIGVFAMLYIRERRLWIWLQPDSGGGTRMRAALSTTRRTLDADAEFESLKTALLHDALPDEPATDEEAR
ncbi:cytochrome c biogenesis protein ResB [Aquincola sp. S2]|uniref:Cytochrome c biogenesis protein ResB n=2 Tax=Pseudaquabacterium terrae TaxID=2732868 RepID=A0ABX2ET72_9BURK|nr:cytochrome c biogenesis protein ResB [Aquabacterium terrae]NRF71900.1 cytochrome c biogenesis protein ResB [Aquabacterium terrae]